MLLKIRTKDNLIELLKKGISSSWKINHSRLEHIQKIEIFDFSGTVKLCADFDRDNSIINENGRISVAFQNGFITKDNFLWIGQNPIKFVNNSQEIELSEEEIETAYTASNSDRIENIDLKEIEWNEAKEVAQKINPRIYTSVSSFFEVKDHEEFNALLTAENNVRITAKHPRADDTTIYYFEISSSGIEFQFSNQNQGIYAEILNEFDDIQSYFEVDYDYGSTVARLLNQKYQETFESRIDSGDDLALDEDFKVYFIDNFVNYILNDVYMD